MSEQFGLQKNAQKQSESPNADVETMSVAELHALIDSLSTQIMLNRSADPEWAHELEEQRESAQTKLALLNTSS